MSKISLTPNVSGTGTLNIAAPNTNTDRTITLPDATTTLVGNDNLQTLSNKNFIGTSIFSPTGPTDAVGLEIGGGRSGNGSSFVDLIGDTTYGDYGTRLIRQGTGTSTLIHRGTGVLGLFAQDSAAMSFSTTSAERMRITSTGNVGIGTATPAVSLDIGGSAIPQVRLLSNTNGVDLRFQAVGGSSTAVVGTLSNHPLAVFTNNTEKMRILTNGNVGIGTIAPTEKLDVEGNGRFTGSISSKTGSNSYLSIIPTAVATNSPYVAVFDASNIRKGYANYWNGTDYIVAQTDSATALAFGTNNTERMRISTTGNITQSNATSGNGDIAGTQVFRLAADGAAIGPAISNYFGANSAISLEAGSMYEITIHTFFLKTTASTLTWTLTASSAPTSVVARNISTPITGTSGVGIANTVTSLATAATAFPATGSLTTGVNHAFEFSVRVLTNLATNLRLNATQVSGTITPRAGSYYTVKKISASTGTFVA